MKTIVLCGIMMMFVVAFAGVPEVRNVKAFQQSPWGRVCISYEVVGDIAASAENGKAPFLLVTAKDKTTGREICEVSSADSCLSGDMSTAVGLHKVVWDIATQGVTINSGNVVFAVMYLDEYYMVVDLSSWYYPVTYQTSRGWTDDHKTTKLVLRLVDPGSFKRGTHNVTLTKPFYLGVFEVTQKQYTLVMGSNPSKYQGDKRPVEQVSYDAIRGSSNGAKWPSSSAVDASSFIGKLRARTGLNFDLPTQAQWEYACRAGTTSEYNNGGDGEDDLKLLGRYCGNCSDGKGGYSEHTTVGSYLPNAWGLYDMHGNVSEWCLDWAGNLSGTLRVYCGGDWAYSATINQSGQTLYSTSSYSLFTYPSDCRSELGFRLAITLSE